MPTSFKRHRFPAEMIHHAVWLYFCFTLHIRDVEERLVERGAEVSREAIRRSVIEFGPAIAANLRRRRWSPPARWRAQLSGFFQPTRRSTTPSTPRPT